MSKSKWIYKNLKSPEFNVLAEKFGVHPAIIKILADRGVQGEDAVREYLEADIATVSDGSELTDMQRGVNIVYDAVQAGKYIRIMGDYDVDGVSSTYILYKGLTGLGAKCDSSYRIVLQMVMVFMNQQFVMRMKLAYRLS